MVQVQQEECALTRGVFGMPKPQGWTLERVVSLIAGAVVITTQMVGGERSARLRLFTGFVGANLLLNAAVGWCPTSLLLHRLGLPTGAERALDRGA